MTEIFREVDEALREDRAKALWRKYGTVAVSVAAAIVLATASYVFWQDYSVRRDRELTGELLVALELGEADRAAAIEALAAVADAAADRQGVIARLHEAALRAEGGDVSGAIDIYRALAEDASVPEGWRSLARLLAVLHGLDGGDPAVLTAELEPLIEDDSPWRYNARELTGLLALRQGDATRAREVFDLLAADPQAPPGIRTRALELAGAAGG